MLTHARLVLTGALAFTVTAHAAQQAVLRDQFIEITMPPGIAMPAATKAPDAKGADYSTETDTGVYRLQYVDMPAGSTKEKLFDAILANLKQGSNVDSHERFTRDGHDGLRLYINQPGLNQVMRMDCFFVNGKLFRVWFITRDAAQLRDPRVVAFFESFRIKP